jgi:hypothetical protein
VLGGLKALAVLRYDQNHPQATSGMTTGRYWHIDAITTTAAAFNLGLALPHANLADPNVCKWPGELGGMGWDCARSGFNSTIVWRNNLSALSDWAVGNDVGPTAVEVKTFRAAAGDSSGRWLLVLLAALIGAALLRMISFQRIKEADNRIAHGPSV